jgi:myo-inositol 2-dehydrogenase / D-chiro-inositol 1-dehydrogenase
MNSSPLSNGGTTSTRRDFLKTSTATTAGLLAGPAILGTKSSAASPGDELRVGLIGCGGRGSEAAMNALRGDPNAVLTAVGDLYASTIDSKLNAMRDNEELSRRVKVEKKNQFVGLDAYKAVLDSGVDVVILATPPGFRPQHMKAAVEAGKHMFVEKPMATDAPGVRSLMESVARAKERKLAVCAGFCWRYSSPQRALYEKIHQGEIGQVTAMYATYNTGFLWDRSNPSDVTPLQKQLRMWYYYTWLSGDHLCEQAIHAIDWLQWVKKDVVPVKCMAHGGRQVRTAPKYGNIFDHFEVVYEYADGTRGFLFTRQQAGCANDNSAVYFGTEGVGRDLGFSGTRILGGKNEIKWRYEGPKPVMYDVEHAEFFASIRSGKLINDGDRMITSTMVGIMGRMAAYTGQEITYEQAVNSQEKLVPDNLTWDSPAPEVKVAIPGQTPFV